MDEYMVQRLEEKHQKALLDQTQFMKGSRRKIWISWNTGKDIACSETIKKRVKLQHIQWKICRS